MKLLGDVYLCEDASVLRFGNAALELEISKRTGNWLALTARQTGTRLVVADEATPVMLLRVGGRRAQPKQVRNSRMADLVDAQIVGLRTRYQAHDIVHDADAVILEVTVAEGDWHLTSHLALRPGEATIRRTFTIRYDGLGEALLRDVRLVVPGLQLGAEAGTTIEAPGYPTRCHVPVSTIPLGIWGGLDSRPSGDPERVQHSVDVPGSAPGLIGLVNEGLGLSLLVWVRSVTEFCMVQVERTADGLRLEDWLFVADRFCPGHTLRAGTQTIALRRGSWRQALEWFQDGYDRDGFITPADRPGWAREAAIYEVHIGSAPFVNGVSYAPYPRVADLICDLPRISALGFNVIQLMPHWPFCGYTVTDYYDVDQSYGDEAQVRELVCLAHSMGIKVILDVVLHGCVDQEIVRWDMETFGRRYDFIFGEWLARAHARSPYRDEHPEWFMRDEDGDIARVYTWAFDPANPAWQDFIVGVLTFYVREFHVDGFRFDAPTWNCMPNWDRHLPYRASASYYGAHGLFVKVRRALKALDPDILMYTEPSGPLFRRTMDLNYNYDEEWFSGSLFDAVSPRGYAGSRSLDGHPLTAREIATWLECRRLALPRGSITVHHLDSHDTFWWGEKAQFRHEAFGVEAARVLFALFALLDGGIMSYVGAERGSEAFYCRLLHLRQAIPALRYGECDNTAVGCGDAMVLAFLRTCQGEHAIPVLNLNGRAARAILRLPVDRLGLGCSSSCFVHDLFSDELLAPAGGVRLPTEDLEQLEVEMPAYGVRVLRVYPC